jgi:hypothetical protein
MSQMDGLSAHLDRIVEEAVEECELVHAWNKKLSSLGHVVPSQKTPLAILPIAAGPLRAAWPRPKQRT